MRNSKLILTLVFSIIVYNAVKGQFGDNYSPRESYTRKSRQLIKAIDNRYVIQANRMGNVKYELYEKYEELTANLISAIRKEKFIADYDIESTVNNVYSKLISSNELNCTPGRILILRSAQINALCYGEGTLILNVGLLGRISNEDELAFVVAHELAHYELDHVKHKMILLMNSSIERRATRVATKIQKGNVLVKDLVGIYDLFYENSRYNRRMELQADSLAYLFIENAGFRYTGALSVLDKLDALEQEDPAIGDDLFRVFHSSKYPFQDSWLKRRLSVYSKEGPDSRLFARDSLKSHPDVPLRKELLRKHFVRYSSAEIDFKAEQVQLMARTAEFECVESAYNNREYDVCLYYALKLKRLYPENAFLTTVISKVLADLFIALESDVFANYVPMKTINYGDDLKLANNFLHNLLLEDIGELAFHFLNNQTNFRKNNEEHYYLLWKISGLTSRDNVQKNVIQTYKGEFPKGKYLSKMTNRTLRTIGH